MYVLLKVVIGVGKNVILGSQIGESSGGATVRVN
jgi:hypothetical protein